MRWLRFIDVRIFLLKGLAENSVYTNSGDQRLAGYGYTIFFDESIVQVDQSVGSNGVTAGYIKEAPTLDTVEISGFFQSTARYWFIIWCNGSLPTGFMWMIMQMPGK